MRQIFFFNPTKIVGIQLKIIVIQRLIMKLTKQRKIRGYGYGRLSIKC